MKPRAPREYINKQTQVSEGLIVDRFGDVWVNLVPYEDGAYEMPPAPPKKNQFLSNIVYCKNWYVVDLYGDVWFLSKHDPLAEPVKLSDLENVRQVLPLTARYPNFNINDFLFVLKKDRTLWRYTLTDDIPFTQIAEFDDIISLHNEPVGRSTTGESLFFIREGGFLWQLYKSGESVQLQGIENAIDFVYPNALLADGTLWDYRGTRLVGSDYAALNDAAGLGGSRVTCDGHIHDKYGKEITAEHVIAMSGRSIIREDNSVWLLKTYLLRPTAVDARCIFQEGLAEGEYPTIDNCEREMNLTTDLPLAISGKLDSMSDSQTLILHAKPGTYQIDLNGQGAGKINLDLYRYFPFNKLRLFCSLNVYRGYFSVDDEQDLYCKISYNPAKAFELTDFTVNIEQKPFVGVKKLSASARNCQLLVEDGSVWQWNAHTTYAQVDHIKHVKDLSSGNILLNDGTIYGNRDVQNADKIDNNIALLTDGTLWYWPRSWKMKDGDNVRLFSSGDEHRDILLLKNDNTMWYYSSPTGSSVLIPTPGTVRQLSASYALLEDGRVWKHNYKKWELVGNLENIIALSEGAIDRNILCLDQNGDIWQVYGGVKKVNISEVQIVAGGNDYNLAMRQDDSIWGWGKNYFCTDMPSVPSFKDPVGCMGMTGPGDDHPADFTDLPIIYLPLDETPIILTGVIDYASDNDSFAISSALDSCYRMELICNSPHVQTQLYHGSKPYDISLPYESIMLSDTILYIRAYYLANAPFTETPYSIRLTRVADIARESTPLSVVKGQTYSIPLLGQAIPGIEGRMRDRFHVLYDPNVLELLNHQAQQEGTGIPEYWLDVTEQIPGKLVFTPVKPLHSEREWTGLIAGLQFRALASGNTEVQTLCEF